MFSQMDCSVMKTVWQTQHLVSLSNHKYLDNQTGDRFLKFIGFLTGLNPNKADVKGGGGHHAPPPRFF